MIFIDFQKKEIKKQQAQKNKIKRVPLLDLEKILYEATTALKKI